MNPLLIVVPNDINRIFPALSGGASTLSPPGKPQSCGARRRSARHVPVEMAGLTSDGDDWWFMTFGFSTL